MAEEREAQDPGIFHLSKGDDLTFGKFPFAFACSALLFM